VDTQEEFSPELKEFIDQLIVPLLVARLLAETGHLYSDEGSGYDTEGPRAQAA
jgi:hypothetical protein